MCYYAFMKALAITLVVLAAIGLLAHFLQNQYIERPIEEIRLNQERAQMLLDSATGRKQKIGKE